MPPGTATLSRVPRATRATPKNVEFGVVTSSQSDEERTQTSTPSGLATHEEGVSGILGVLWSEASFASTEVAATATAEQYALSD